MNTLFDLRKMLMLWGFVLIPVVAYGGDYLWPTNASHYLTSSFAEYRPGHFHAGIDIKTWNREGFKVFAIQDGHIWRVRVSSYGYGRVIYQKLDTGEIIIYGHLKEFNNELEQLVKREQKRNEEYRVNKYFSPTEFRVKKGDVIAYTGSSGIGKPHLHFEVRDSHNQPMNPFLLGYSIQDNIPPGISGFCMTPLDAKSRIDGDAKPTIFQPRQVRHGEYVIKEKPLVKGRIGLSVDCWDKANGVQNVFAIYRFNFYVDGQLQYSAVYDKFSYEVSGLIDLDRDFRLNKRGIGLYQNLYKEHGNDLPFYKPPDVGSGILNCDASETAASEEFNVRDHGPHQYLIELYDYNGNLTTLSGEFLVGEQQPITVVYETDDFQNYTIAQVHDKAGIPFRDYSIFRSTNYGDAWKQFFPHGQTAADQDMLMPILYLRQPVEIVKIVAKDTFDLPTMPDFEVLTKDADDFLQSIEFELIKDFYDNYLRIELNVNGLIKAPPRLFIQQVGVRPMEVDLAQFEFNQFIGAYELQANRDGIVDVEVYAQDLSGKEVYFWDQFEITTITPENGGQIISKDRKCSVQFDNGGVFENLFARMEKEPANGDTAKYDIVGSTYLLEPFDVPLNKNAVVRLKYPENDTLLEKLGVYTRDSRRRNGWRFSGNSLDRAQGTISAQLSSLRQVTLIRDTEPPDIQFYYPKNNSNITRRYPILRARVYDSLSGFNDESSITMKLDDRKVIAEYDPEERLIRYNVEDALPLGSHTVTVSAIDNSGNEQSVTNTFYVVQ
ncbi:M23 family metallopeptidase [candidate division KSB1 bacterium]|nr:M23 family metallopeptidase [candidate division KSB1 bacterium]